MVAPLPAELPWRKAIGNGEITVANAGAYAAALKDYVAPDMRLMLTEASQWNPPRSAGTASPGPAICARQRTASMSAARRFRQNCDAHYYTAQRAIFADINSSHFRSATSTFPAAGASGTPLFLQQDESASYREATDDQQPETM